MTIWHGVHGRLYRWVLRLTPGGHRVRHGDQQEQLFADLLATGHRPWRLWVQVIPDLVGVYLSTPRLMLASHLSRIALYPLSVLNSAAGLVLATVALASNSVPNWVAAPAVAVAIQGGFTLGWLSGRLPANARLGHVLMVSGESAGLVAGLVATAMALINQTGSGDPEYGPLSILALVVAHALLGLLAVAAPTASTPVANSTR